MNSTEVRATKFTPVRFREGYATVEVDAFVERVAATLEGRDTVTAEDVEAKLFTPVRLRSGYSMEEVDKFLELVSQELAAS